MNRKLSTFPEPVVQDFAKSGLTPTHMRRMGVTTYPASSNPDAPHQRHLSAAIPYPDFMGSFTNFKRSRIYPAPGTSYDGPKYLQPSESGVHLYLPPFFDWQRVADDASIPLLIVEGEKKGAAGCVLGFPTVAVSGVDCWSSGGAPLPEWERFKWKGREVTILYDSDGAHNRRVMVAAERLGAFLRGKGAAVRIALVPPNGGGKAGLDDFIMQNPETAKERVEALIRSAAPHVLPELALNAELAVVPVGGKALILRETRTPDGQVDVTLSRPADIAPLYKHRSVRIIDSKGELRIVPMFDEWLRSPYRRQYDRLVFNPAGCAEGEYNLFQGFAVKPKAGDCAVALDFIRDIICDGNAEHFAYLMRWLALMFQKPDVLPLVAVVLLGRQGTGKSTFGDLVGRMLGSHHYVHVSTREHLVGKFNAHLERAILVFSDDAVFPGDKASEGILKTLITEPTRWMERKGIDAVEIRNCAHVIIATNHEADVVADQDDRRLFVLQVSGAHADDRPFFGRLRAQFTSELVSALMHHLLQLPVGDFFASRPPKTQAHLKAKLRRLDAAGKFWLDCLVRGSVLGRGDWDTRIPTAQVATLYAEHAKQTGMSQRSTETELGIALRGFVPGLENRKLSSKSGQEPNYIFPDLQVCRDAFARKLDPALTWIDLLPAIAVDSSDGVEKPAGSSRRNRPQGEIKRGKGAIGGRASLKGQSSAAGRIGQLQRRAAPATGRSSPTIGKAPKTPQKPPKRA